ncbi:MAG: molybdopterin-dependent oxidoreductase [Methanosarcinaceae archaeon]|nr:molybdopterin-dependent oxidoreductase [Methanosarcinaceae archaeon]
MSIKITRRDFLKLTAAAVGTVAIGDVASAAVDCDDCHKLAAVPARKQPHQWIPSYCNMCGGMSGIHIDILPNEITGETMVMKVGPNPYNPTGVSNNSKDYFDNIGEGSALCARGNAAVELLYDPDRLQKPMRRTNPAKGRGVEPKFEEITWPEAIAEISEKLGTLKAAGESHKLVWFADGQNYKHLQEDFCNLYGTPNHFQYNQNSDSARKAALKISMGEENAMLDAVESKYILLFGSNPLSSIKHGYEVRTIIRGIENGARLIVVDPYLSFTATKAHEWLPIKPGTDGAFALAMAHVIIKEGLFDEEFIDHWTLGFNDFANFVKDKTPQWAEDITGLSKEIITHTARELALTKPAAIDIGAGVTQHSNAVQTGRAIAALAALTGQIDRRGTIVFPNMGGLARQDVSYDDITEPSLDGDYPFADNSYIGALDAITTGKPYKPKIGVVMGENVVMSTPGTNEVVNALKALEFLVVVGTHINETSELADIVLPATTQFESYDLNENYITWPSVALRQPAIEPLFNQMTEYETIIALGENLKLKTSDGEEFFKGLDYLEYLEAELKNGPSGLSIAELQKLDGAVWTDKVNGTSYEKYRQKVVAPSGSQVDSDGVLHDSNGNAIGVTVWDTFYNGFDTKSRKFEFVSEHLEDLNDANGKMINKMPVYTPVEAIPSWDYPLYLINWHESAHYSVNTQNNVYLNELKWDNPVAIHPKTAEKLNIKTGDKIEVESEYGKASMLALLTDRIRPDTVGWMHGFGHWRMGDVADGKGANVYDVVPMKAEAITGNQMSKEAVVDIRKE